jgi:hypothetical protein
VGLARVYEVDWVALHDTDVIHILLWLSWPHHLSYTSLISLVLIFYNRALYFGLQVSELSSTLFISSSIIVVLFVDRMPFIFLLGLASLWRLVASQGEPISWIDVNPPPEQDTLVQIQGSVTSVSYPLLSLQSGSILNGQLP